MIKIDSKTMPEWNRIMEVKDQVDEPFLTGGVPNLSLDDLVIDTNTPSGEFYADCGFGLKTELITRKPGEEIGFAHTRVTDENHFKEVIVIVIRSIGCHTN